MDRVVTFIAAISAPLLTLLVDQHVVTALAATDIGAIVAAAVGSYHGGKVVQKRSTDKPAA